MPNETFSIQEEVDAMTDDAAKAQCRAHLAELQALLSNMSSYTIRDDSRLSTHVSRVVLERMSLSEQMRLLSASTSLLAVHGQAMAWVLFLPSGQRKTAAVEIFPQGLANPIYRELSATLGTRYESLAAAPARGSCGGASTAARLKCNISVSIGKVLDAAERAVEWTSS